MEVRVSRWLQQEEKDFESVSRSESLRRKSLPSGQLPPLAALVHRIRNHVSV